MSLTNEIRSLWRRIEKRAIYTLLFVYLFLQWTGILWPSLKLPSDFNGPMISLLLLAVLRLLDREPYKRGIDSHSKKFESAINNTITPGSHIDKIDLFAHTSSKYYGVIRNKQIRINHLRLLVASANALKHTPTPLDADDKQAVLQEVSITLKKWIELQKEGGIDKLEIKVCDYVPLFHVLIVDNNKAHLGFFLPRNNASGMRSMHHYAIERTDLIGTDMINDTNSLFNELFDSYSKPIANFIDITNEYHNKNSIVDQRLNTTTHDDG